MRNAACPISTGRGTWRVHLVRGWKGGEGGATAERVAGGRVEARGDEDEVGRELARDGEHNLRGAWLSVST